MGYFSNLATEDRPFGIDHSYTPPEMQLLWRLEELENQLYVLTHQKTGKRDAGISFSEDQLRYVLPEHFLSPANVRSAIDLAIRDLWERYGIRVGDAPAREPPAMDELTGMQLSFSDVLARSAA